VEQRPRGCLSKRRPASGPHPRSWETQSSSKAPRDVLPGASKLPRLPPKQEASPSPTGAQASHPRVARATAWPTRAESRRARRPTTRGAKRAEERRGGRRVPLGISPARNGFALELSWRPGETQGKPRRNPRHELKSSWQSLASRADSTARIPTQPGETYRRRATEGLNHSSQSDRPPGDLCADALGLRHPPLGDQPLRSCRRCVASRPDRRSSSRRSSLRPARSSACPSRFSSQLPA